LSNFFQTRPTPPIADEKSHHLIAQAEKVWEIGRPYRGAFYYAVAFGGRFFYFFSAYSATI
jgi:hypothetical protein